MPMPVRVFPSRNPSSDLLRTAFSCGGSGKSTQPLLYRILSTIGVGAVRILEVPVYSVKVNVRTYHLLHKLLPRHLCCVVFVFVFEIWFLSF